MARYAAELGLAGASTRAKTEVSFSSAAVLTVLGTNSGLPRVFHVQKNRESSASIVSTEYSNAETGRSPCHCRPFADRLSVQEGTRID